MQSPAQAADELDRCVNELGFVGALINGHTHGTHLDDDTLSVIWERAEALGAPIYIHPAYAPSIPEAFSRPAEMSGSLWGWMAETGGHALRLMLCGVFDRYPRAKLVLGHIGESLPFQQWRLDRGYEKLSPALRPQHPPSYYMRRNLWITSSGLPSTLSLRCAIEALGPDRVLFAVDYPFESCEVAGVWLAGAEIDATTRNAIAFSKATALYPGVGSAA